jgi:NADPH-dependent curcumin reductase CurA
MRPAVSREIRLRERPVGLPTAETFEMAEAPVAEIKEGQFLVRNIWMSVDPYMRGRMMDRRSYVAPFEVGQPLAGGCVGQVVESKHERYRAGDYVLGMNGWREYWITSGAGVGKIDPKLAPIQAHLGVLGMPGLTAYAGLLKVGALKEGESVFVSGAAGAVGSVVCQIAKAKGCRVVGSTGSAEKAAWLQSEAGVDEAINYRDAGDLTKAVAKALPEGIDVYFENVGGPHFDAALANMKDFGRIVVCGMISQYNATSAEPGPSNLGLVIPRRLRIQGFIVTDHADLRDQFLADMGGWIGEGKLKWRETVVEGLDKAPEAFLGLFRGDNLGKMLVKIGPDAVV